MSRVDAAGVEWHAHHFRGDAQQEACDSCGVYIYASFALFDAFFLDEATRVLHEHCFELHDHILRLLRDEDDRRDDTNVPRQQERLALAGSGRKVADGVGDAGSYQRKL